MPGLDGYATAELIRRRDRSRHIPIIFVSAIDKDDEHIARAYAMGAVDYVFKPVDPIILRSKIAVLVELYLKNDEVQRKAQLERMLQEENLRIRQEKLEAERQLRQIEERQTVDPALAADRAVQRAARWPFRRAALRRAKASAQAVGFRADAFRRQIRTCGASAFIPKIATRVLERSRRHCRRAAACPTEYRWLCADGSHRCVPRSRGAGPRRRRAAAGNLRQLPRRHRSPRRSSSSCSRRRRWKRSASSPAASRTTSTTC